MLRLFHSIFGNEPGANRYPETLVQAAIERAVGGNGPWLCGCSGYRRKLRPAVVHALDHVVALVDRLDEPVELSRENFGSGP
jgi:xanthine dehydrogenase iron-sulfur cluster and FAD-binding subunit A